MTTTTQDGYKAVRSDLYEETWDITYPDGIGIVASFMGPGAEALAAEFARYLSKGKTFGEAALRLATAG